MDDIERHRRQADAAKGTPIYVANLATSRLGTQFRRSVLEKDGNEVVGGVVMMRHGENPLAVTRRIKEKIRAAAAGLPAGRADRALLRPHAADQRGHPHVTEMLAHEMIIASVAILLILMHFRSVFVICLTLPLAVLVSFILMRLFGIPSNIMSLAGIAIRIGMLVDQSMVMVENATHHLTPISARTGSRGDTRDSSFPPAARWAGRSSSRC